MSTTQVNPTYPTFTQPPCVVMFNSFGGFEFGDVSTQVCLKADAQTLMNALAPVVTAKDGPNPGAKLQLIQQFGTDQNPGQPIDAGGYQWVFQPGELRRDWSIYTTDGVLVASVCESFLATMWGYNSVNGGGIGNPGEWQYKNVYQQFPSWKQLVWVPTAPTVPDETAA